MARNQETVGAEVLQQKLLWNENDSVCSILTILEILALHSITYRSASGRTTVEGFH
jgi:hypothetical protein